MADYIYGGSEEENAELKKLEVDLVSETRTLPCYSRVHSFDFDICYRPMTPITSRPGKNWFVPERRLREASTAIPTPRRSQQRETSLIDSWPSSRCFLDTGRNMPIWNSPSRGLRQQTWWVSFARTTENVSLRLPIHPGLRTRCCQYLTFGRFMDQLLFLQSGDFPRRRRYSRVSIFSAGFSFYPLLPFPLLVTNHYTTQRPRYGGAEYARCNAPLATVPSMMMG